jgi:hypothetical protein
VKSTRTVKALNGWHCNVFRFFTTHRKALERDPVLE